MRRGHRRHVLLGALLAVGLLGGCKAPPMLLTHALLNGEEAAPSLVAGRFVGRIEALRGRLDRAPAERELAVDVVFPEASDQHLPARVRAYGSETGANDEVRSTFTLLAETTRKRWPEDYVEAVRSGVALRLQDAQYFRSGDAAAEVVFAGTVSAAAVATVVPASAVPSAATWAAHAIPDGLAPVLRLLRRGGFAQCAGLVEPGEHVRSDPVAWLGPGDRVLDHEAVLLALQPWREFGEHRPRLHEFDVADCALLVRIVHPDGRVDYLRLPLVMLREGDDLTLARQGDAIAWARRDVWRARMSATPGATASWPDPGVQLASRRIVYGYDALVPPSKLGRILYQTLLAPFAVALDVLAATNPVLQALVDAMLDKPRAFKPSRGNR